ncbi:unnamed protein product [Vitrella brassicaformis CCMP3155]|uniref:Uncharacterized protein n=1 Tax=Vitrella brassicaformis (strain CCMP3155) TaxID=1169540 RepID=A0A0G4EBB2_VITBC|nr:unnamed protein product [Vitrella brassicaformis CCMP3155]|eukprot:CEL93245.1 unnamed protein product [Vitrella brassicaformis CCMP3155]
MFLAWSVSLLVASAWCYWYLLSRGAVSRTAPLSHDFHRVIRINDGAAQREEDADGDPLSGDFISLQPKAAKRKGWNVIHYLPGSACVALWPKARRDSSLKFDLLATFEVLPALSGTPGAVSIHLTSEPGHFLRADTQSAGRYIKGHFYGSKYKAYRSLADVKAPQRTSRLHKEASFFMRDVDASSSSGGASASNELSDVASDESPSDDEEAAASEEDATVKSPSTRREARTVVFESEALPGLYIRYGNQNLLSLTEVTSRIATVSGSPTLRRRLPFLAGNDELARVPFTWRVWPSRLVVRGYSPLSLVSRFSPHDTPSLRPEDLHIKAIYSIFSLQDKSAHVTLFEKFVHSAMLTSVALPSRPSGGRASVPPVDPPLEIRARMIHMQGDGTAKSESWFHAIASQSRYWVDVVRENFHFNRSEDSHSNATQATCVIGCDVDIQFYPGWQTKVKECLQQHDICFQREAPINTGFFAMRCNERTLHWWTSVRDHLVKDRKGRFNKWTRYVLTSAEDLKMRWSTFSHQAILRGRSAAINHKSTPMIHHAIGIKSPDAKLHSLRKIRERYLATST